MICVKDLSTVLFSVISFMLVKCKCYIPLTINYDVTITASFKSCRGFGQPKVTHSTLLHYSVVQVYSF